MAEISLATQKLLERYHTWQQMLQPSTGEATIKVDEFASKVAGFYEKIREVVDYREKHLMRRVAIERILKRRLFLKADTQAMAEPFVCELVRGGYFPNEEVRKSKVKEVQGILDKYNFILQRAPGLPKHRNQGEFYTQILSIAACEIEEAFDPAFYAKEDALVEYMETVMRQRIQIGSRAQAVQQVSQHDKNIQIHIAVQQALLKLDAPIIIYNLLKRRYADWFNLTPEKLIDITSNVFVILDEIDANFKHFLADKFYKICERYDTAYLLLGDILEQNKDKIDKILNDSGSLKAAVKKVYSKRYKTLRSRMARAAFYSTLSIFLTNVFSLYVLEFPFAHYVMGNINLFAAIMDVVGPTFLMFLLVITIKMPKFGNLQLVEKEIEKIVYDQEKQDIYEVELYPRRNIFFTLIIRLLYFLSFIVCFGAIIYLLYKLQYPPLSYLLLIMFTSLIAFAGVKLRQRARELHVTEEKTGFFYTLIEIFALPIVRLGKWLSARWKKINIVAVMFTFLIDTPFLLFVEFLEQWRYFLKEKKEEIR